MKLLIFMNIYIFFSCHQLIVSFVSIANDMVNLYNADKCATLFFFFDKRTYFIHNEKPSTIKGNYIAASIITLEWIISRH